ncbi:PEP-CTERM sorting domain-containing protein [Marinobacter changyiensis]|uniref:PEP-CTERM sorting domain-containing protein n=1 Tax=Marinobacter changyiensis TaxID=2604091 RepID=UPI0012644526|nr:PEP-CTERM sorting domain-containing protein [Marinobacter changyiensis]
MELSKVLKTVFVATALMMASAASHALLLQPGNADYDGNDGAGSYGPGNCEPGCINDLFGTSFANNDDGLLYKAEFDGGLEEGGFTGSYEMTWALDATGGTLSWLEGTPFIVCGECYVAVKDGNNDPRYYFFDLSFGSELEWDGKEDLEFSNFWANTQGSISHISIWGDNTPVEVPEPSTLGLLGLGLMGLVYSRKRKANR